MENGSFVNRVLCCNYITLYKTNAAEQYLMHRIWISISQKLQSSKHCIMSEQYSMRDRRKNCDGLCYEIQPPPPKLWPAYYLCCCSTYLCGSSTTKRTKEKKFRYQVPVLQATRIFRSRKCGQLLIDAHFEVCLKAAFQEVGKSKFVIS